MVKGKFDVITSFRFFMNAEQSLRDKAFMLIKSKLINKDSIFIFNIYGNRYSTRGPIIAFDRMFTRKPSKQLSLNEIRKMLKQHSFEIIEYHGVGFIYKSYYKFMPKLLWDVFEIFLHQYHSSNHFLCTLFSCVKKTAETHSLYKLVDEMR